MDLVNTRSLLHSKNRQAILITIEFTYAQDFPQVQACTIKK